MPWIPRHALLRSLLTAILVALPAWCLAHARLEQAQPARRSALTSSPAQVRLRFNEAVELQYSHLSVTDSTGHTLSTAPTLALDANTLEIALPTLSPGAYTVHYRVLSVDGHVIESAYPFTLQAPAAAP